MFSNIGLDMDSISRFKNDLTKINEIRGMFLPLSSLYASLLNQTPQEFQDAIDQQFDEVFDTEFYYDKAKQEVIFGNVQLILNHKIPNDIIDYIVKQYIVR
jgi:hypothetical protein